MAGWTGLEPAVTSVTGWCFNQLSYHPINIKVNFKSFFIENYADGKKPGRKGLAKRKGVNCKQSVSKLRSIAKNSSGERQRMAHWCANMKSGKKK